MSSNKHWQPILLLLFIYTASVAGWLGADVFWFDEVTSLYYAGGMDEPAPQTLSAAIQSQINEDMADETNPPGYYVALFFWVRLVGTSEFAVRALSLLAGALTIALVYRAGTDMHTPYAGLAAAVLLGMCAFFVYYTHEARSYALYSLFVVLSVWTYHRLTTRPTPSPAIYALFVVALTGLMYAHYLASMLILAAAVYHLLFAPKNRRWWVITGCVVLAGLLFAPWLAYALRAFSHVSENPSRAALALEFLPLAGELAARFANQSPLLLAVLLVAALPGRRYAWFLLAGTFLLTVLANEIVGFISDMHYMMAVFPLLALVAGAGVTRFRRYGVVILVLWTAAGLWYIRHPVREAGAWHLYLPWDTLAAQVGATIQPDDTVIFHLPDPDPAWIHSRGVDYYLGEMDIHLLESFTTSSADHHTNQLADFIDDAAPRLWLVWDTNKLPSVQGMIARDRYMTAARYVDCGVRTQLDTLNARLYVDPPPAADLRLLERGVRVGLAAASPHLFAPHRYEVTLATANGDTVDGDLYVELQVLDANNVLVLTYPTLFPKIPNGCMHFMADISTLAPGGYRFYIAVYDAATGIALPPQSNPDAERMFLFDAMK